MKNNDPEPKMQVLTHIPNKMMNRCTYFLFKVESMNFLQTFIQLLRVITHEYYSYCQNQREKSYVIVPLDV